MKNHEKLLKQMDELEKLLSARTLNTHSFGREI